VPASVCKPAFVHEGRICSIETHVFRHESSDDFNEVRAAFKNKQQVASFQKSLAVKWWPLSGDV